MQKENPLCALHTTASALNIILKPEESIQRSNFICSDGVLSNHRGRNGVFSYVSFKRQLYIRWFSKKYLRKNDTRHIQETTVDGVAI